MTTIYGNNEFYLIFLEIKEMIYDIKKNAISMPLFQIGDFLLNSKKGVKTPSSWYIYS